MPRPRRALLVGVRLSTARPRRTENRSSAGHPRRIHPASRQLQPATPSHRRTHSRLSPRSSICLLYLQSQISNYAGTLSPRFQHAFPYLGGAPSHGSFSAFDLLPSAFLPFSPRFPRIVLDSRFKVQGSRFKVPRPIPAILHLPSSPIPRPRTPGEKAVETTKYTNHTKDERLTKRTRLAHPVSASVGPNLCPFVYFEYFVVPPVALESASRPPLNHQLADASRLARSVASVPSCSQIRA